MAALGGPHLLFFYNRRPCMALRAALLNYSGVVYTLTLDKQRGE